MEKLPVFGDDHILPRVDPLPFSERTWELWKNFIDTYRAYVDDYYAEQYSEFPDLFPFKQPLKWIFVYKNQEFEAHIFLSESDSCEYAYFQFVTLGESRTFSRLPPYLQKEREKEIIGRSDNPLAIIKYKYGFPAPALTYDPNYVTENPDDLAKMGETDGRAFAKRHGERARGLKDQQFNIYGLEELVPQVDSASFEYELGESIAAYKAGLYLAAGATAGIALENLLRIIIEKKAGQKALPIEPYIWKSAKYIRENRLVPGRLANEASSFDGIRNSNSHTNEDPVREKSLEALYLLIKDLIPFAI